jgi:hypothetical protein
MDPRLKPLREVELLRRERDTEKALRDERSACGVVKRQHYCTTNWNVAEEEVVPEAPLTVIV